MIDLASLLTALLALACFLLFTTWRRLARALVVAVTAILVTVGITPVPRLMLRPLEDRFPPADPGKRPLAGIVVLGGLEERRGQMAFYSSGARPIQGIALALRHPESRLLFSGGDGSTAKAGATEAEAGLRLAAGLDVPVERVMVETGSRNTAENAAFTAAILALKPGECWALVTSAFHMPRAIGAFRAVGLDLEPHPVDFRTTGDAGDWTWWNAGVGAGLALADVAVHEWIGLLWYRLTGRTRDLFPAPLAPTGACVR